MENEFRQKDEEGRLVFQQYCKNNKSWCNYVKGSKDDYASWDVAYTSGSTQVIGEIKMRDYPSDAFDGWFLEESKLNGLKVVKQQINDKQKQPVALHYINFFNDGMVMIWDISNLDSEVEMINLNKTTYGTPIKMDKGIITLPTFTAIKREMVAKISIGNPNANPDDDELPF